MFMNGYLDRYARWENAKYEGGIVDEGPLQNTLSYPKRVLTDEEMKIFIKGLPASDKLIVVSIPKDVRDTRQKERGRVVRDEKWDECAQKNFDTCVRSLRALSTSFLVYPETSLDDIVRTIESHA